MSNENNNNNSYGQESISSLKGADRVRLRPGVIFGTSSKYGCAHGIFEIVSNSVDEAKEGYGNTIILEYKKDGAVRVIDFGRGVPLDWNPKENRYNWDLVFCELYAGGKYGGDNYGDSIGLNGLGACATQYASEYMNVTSFTNGVKYEVSFEKGYIVGELRKSECDKGLSGTIIEFKPDLEVFDEIIIEREYFADMFRRQAMTNDSIKFILKYEGTPDQEFYYPNGISEFLKSYVKDAMVPIYRTRRFATGRDREDKPEYRLSIDCAITFSRKHPIIEFYHNASHLSYGGVHEKALKYAVPVAFKKAMLDLGLLKDDKLSYNDIEDMLCVILTTSCPGRLTQYENQTKKAVTNEFIRKALQEFLREEFKQWITDNPDDAIKVMKEIQANKESRMKADEVRKQILSKFNTPKRRKNFIDRPEKFRDCDSKKVDEIEIYLVEGDSAAGSCILGRDAKRQAILPLKGKTLNCSKADLIKILKNDTIMETMLVFGCGFEISDKYLKDLPQFDINNLKFGKIIICTDADVDGMQIRCLVLTMIRRLCPTLLRMGKVYIAESPLFEIIVGKETYFAYSDEERDDIVAQHQGKKIKINRSKGLGENDPKMMWDTTMNPKTRRLIRISYEDTENLDYVFEALLGDDLDGRREMIEEYAQSIDVDDIDFTA